MSSSRSNPDSKKGEWREPLLRAGEYGLALVAVAAGFGLRYALTTQVGPGLPTYITFYPAVMLAAVVAGLWPGVLATAATVFVVDRWVPGLHGKLGEHSGVDLVGMVLFAIMGVLMSVLAELYRRTRQKAIWLEAERQRKIAEVLERERQRFSDVLNMVPAYVVLLSLDYHVPFANRFFEERFGKSKGKRCYEYLFNRTEPCEKCESYTVLETNAPHRWEWTGPDGRNYDVHDFPFTDADGSKLIMEVGLDITERKQAEAALKQANETLERRVAQRTAELRESEALFRAVFEASTDCILVWDREYNYLYANQAAIDHVSTTRDKVVGKNIRDGLGHVPDFMKLWMSRVDRAVATGESFRVEDAVPVGDRLIYSESQISPIRDAAGCVFAVVVVYRDVTERKRAEEALRASEEQFRRAVEDAPVPVIMHAEDGEVLHISRTWTELTGYTLADVPTLEAWLNRAYGEGADEVRNYVHGLFRDGQRRTTGLEFPVRTSAGEVRHWSFSASSPGALRDGRRFVVGMAVDITERKQGEDALRESESFYRQTLESIPGMVFTTRPDGYCDYQSQQWVDFTGVPMSKHVGDGWNKLQHPDDRARSFAAWRAAVEDRAPYDLEYRVRRHDGVYEWFKVIGRPIRDASGKIARWFGVAANINELKNAEEALLTAKAALARANEELELKVQERTAKLAELVGELEHFSYTITHDMRAPLRAMHGFADVVSELCADCGRAEPKGLLKRIGTSADRMDMLITDALNYSKAVRQELPLAPVDAGELLRGMIDTYPEFQASRANIQVQGEIPLVMANEAGLTQCISNLLGNAVKFVQPGQTPSVRVWAEQRGSKSEVRSPKSEQRPVPETEGVNGKGGWVRIWFEDNGIGIQEPMLSRVFDMFSRGHKTYEGTGIGLALVRKVAQRMGGRVGVESEEGKGSRFWLELPGAA